MRMCAYLHHTVRSKTHISKVRICFLFFWGPHNFNTAQRCVWGLRCTEKVEVRTGFRLRSGSGLRLRIWAVKWLMSLKVLTMIEAKAIECMRVPGCVSRGCWDICGIFRDTIGFMHMVCHVSPLGRMWLQLHGGSTVVLTCRAALNGAKILLQFCHSCCLEPSWRWHWNSEIYFYLCFSPALSTKALWPDRLTNFPSGLKAPLILVCCGQRESQNHSVW